MILSSAYVLAVVLKKKRGTEGVDHYPVSFPGFMSVKSKC